MIQKQPVRILAIAPLSRGLGYAVMEGPDRLVACGNKVILRDKNAEALAWVKKFIQFYQPDVLVLPDVNAKDTHRAPRIQSLHRQIVALAKKHRLKLPLISATRQRQQLLGNPKATKQAMAEALAKTFPVELGSRLPPKRRPWTSEDPRMDIFYAVGLAVVFWPKRKL